MDKHITLTFLMTIVTLCTMAQWTTNASGDAINNNSSGNVGIGVDPPLEKLHVNGSIRGNSSGGALRINTPTGYLDLGSMNSSWAHFQTDRSKFYFSKPVYVDGSISSYNTNDLFLQTNGTTRITVLTSNGYTGIGTTPSETLHINGNVRGNQAGALRISTGNGYIDVGPKNTGWAHFYTDRPRFYFEKGITVNEGLIGSYDEDIQLQTSGVTRLRIQNGSGNVGIGTDSPGSFKLAVNGKVWAQEVQVALTNPGPDYVFEPTYKLLSLEEIKSYIDQHKHLPEVPSAKEMETKGVNVSEMNMILLKKIEELTLYTIELNQKINQLNAKLNEIKKP